MPPKPKYTRDEIIEGAFRMAREQGEEALTAREVGKYLQVSSTPIFTMFRDMDDLHEEVLHYAARFFADYIRQAEQFEPAYKMRGLLWVRFARENPHLFRMLFMRKDSVSQSWENARILQVFGQETDFAILMRDYHATREQAERLFHHLWVYTYGICVLCVTGACEFSEEEVSRQLGEVFLSLVRELRQDETLFIPLPVPCGTAEAEQLKELHPDLRK